MERREEYRAWHGYVLVAGFFVVSFLVSVCHNQSFYLANNIGMKIKTALVATVYRKVGPECHCAGLFGEVVVYVVRLFLVG